MQVILSLIASFLIIGIAIFAFIRGMRQEKKRTEALSIFADNTGFEFYPKGDKKMIYNLSDFELFGKGRYKKITNLMFRELAEGKIFVFDYEYMTGTGKHTTIHKHTVMCIQADSLNLPRFILRPEGLWDKLAGAFGYDDIDFDAYEDFSKSYLLKGKNKVAIRKIFNRMTIHFYENHKGLCTEGNFNTILYYHPYKRVKPEELQDFIDVGYEIFDLFNRVY